jgi:hypothetical protein
MNQQAYEPRKNYLMHYGRKNFVNKMIDAMPYYRENVPDYIEGKIHDNLWVDLACYDNYQVSFHDFLYGKLPSMSHVIGIKDIETLFKRYYKKFGIEWKYNHDDIFND